MTRSITFPEVTVEEEIVSIEHAPIDGRVVFLVGLVNAQGEVVTPQTFERFVVADTDYAELMGETPPAWALDKPAGTFRVADLWHYADTSRQNQGGDSPGGDHGNSRPF